MKKGAKHDTWPPIPPKVARAVRKAELLESEGLDDVDNEPCSNGACPECFPAPGPDPSKVAR